MFWLSKKSKSYTKIFDQPNIFWIDKIYTGKADGIGISPKNHWLIYFSKPLIIKTCFFTFSNFKFVKSCKYCRWLRQKLDNSYVYLKKYGYFFLIFFCSVFLCSKYGKNIQRKNPEKNPSQKIQKNIRIYFGFF